MVGPTILTNILNNIGNLVANTPPAVDPKKASNNAAGQDNGMEKLGPHNEYVGDLPNSLASPSEGLKGINRFPEPKVENENRYANVTLADLEKVLNVLIGGLNILRRSNLDDTAKYVIAFLVKSYYETIHFGVIEDSGEGTKQLTLVINKLNKMRADVLMMAMSMQGALEQEDFEYFAEMKKQAVKIAYFLDQVNGSVKQELKSFIGQVLEGTGKESLIQISEEDDIETLAEKLVTAYNIVTGELNDGQVAASEKISSDGSYDSFQITRDKFPGTEKQWKEFQAVRKQMDIPRLDSSVDDDDYYAFSFPLPSDVIAYVYYRLSEDAHQLRLPVDSLGVDKSPVRIYKDEGLLIRTKIYLSELLLKYRGNESIGTPIEMTVKECDNAVAVMREEDGMFWNKANFWLFAVFLVTVGVPSIVAWRRSRRGPADLANGYLFGGSHVPRKSLNEKKLKERAMQIFYAKYLESPEQDMKKRSAQWRAAMDDAIRMEAISVSGALIVELDEKAGVDVIRAADITHDNVEANTIKYNEVYRIAVEIVGTSNPNYFSPAWNNAAEKAMDIYKAAEMSWQRVFSDRHVDPKDSLWRSSFIPSAEARVKAMKIYEEQLSSAIKAVSKNKEEPNRAADSEKAFESIDKVNNFTELERFIERFSERLPELRVLTGSLKSLAEKSATQCPDEFKFVKEAVAEYLRDNEKPSAERRTTIIDILQAKVEKLKLNERRRSALRELTNRMAERARHVLRRDKEDAGRRRNISKIR